jgi:hypothetical protein
MHCGDSWRDSARSNPQGRAAAPRGHLLRARGCSCMRTRCYCPCAKACILWYACSTCFHHCCAVLSGLGERCGHQCPVMRRYCDDAVRYTVTAWSISTGALGACVTGAATVGDVVCPRRCACLWRCNAVVDVPKRRAMFRNAASARSAWSIAARWGWWQMLHGLGIRYFPSGAGRRALALASGLKHRRG